jgi:hypothetical protein
MILKPCRRTLLCKSDYTVGLWYGVFHTRGMKVTHQSFTFLSCVRTPSTQCALLGMPFDTIIIITFIHGGVYKLTILEISGT